MEQGTNNTFEYINTDIQINNQEEVKTILSDITQTENKQLAEDFVTGLPNWDLEPPYEVIRRVTR